MNVGDHVVLSNTERAEYCVAPTARTSGVIDHAEMLLACAYCNNGQPPSRLSWTKFIPVTIGFGDGPGISAPAVHRMLLRQRTTVNSAAMHRSHLLIKPEFNGLRNVDP